MSIKRRQAELHDRKNVTILPSVTRLADEIMTRRRKGNNFSALITDLITEECQRAGIMPSAFSGKE
jgi:hypothetical protein